jgi:carboxymethylenebutenolidase
VGSGAVLTFQSGGAAIRLERFDAAATGSAPRPAVLLLHGAEGLARGDVYRLGARTVAAAGYHAFMLHYLDRTGERRASFATLRSYFPAWIETIRDGVGQVGAQPGIDADRIGIIGASLGGSLAIATSAEDSRIKALVDYFGFVPPALAESATRLPPTLILHGADDSIVPVSNAYGLQALLERLGVEHEIGIYPGQGHGLTGHDALDAATRVNAFLRRHLGRA